jgi:hypothetical protein
VLLAAGFALASGAPAPAPPAAGAAAETATLRGHAGIEVRWFPRSGADPRQGDLPVAAFVQPEFSYRWPAGGPRLRVTGFARWDDTDAERRGVDLRELLLSGTAGDWDWDAGVGKFFWGALEAAHFVDVVNQTDLAGDPDGEEKLGQPLVSLAWRGPVGRLGVFWLPGFRERDFPGAKGRLRTIPRVDDSAATFDRGSRRHHENAALRYETRVRSADVGLHVYRGTARDPLLAPAVNSAGEIVLRPRYPHGTQAGLDAQLAVGEWLGKAEVLHRHFAGETYWQAGLGAEYTFHGVAGSGADIGLIAEYLHDSRGRNPYNPFERDVAAGARWAWNDFGGTEVLGILIVDTARGDVVGKLEASRRFGGSWVARATARTFSRIPADAFPLNGYRRDAVVGFTLERHF